MWDIVLWSGGVTITHRNGCRFADIEDAGEITALVNDSHGIQRVSASQVASDLSGGTGGRWVLVETPYPDEILIGCARLEVEGKQKVCVVSAFAIGKEFQGKGAGGDLMKKVETTVRGMGCEVCNLRIGHWEESVIKWAEGMGYEQAGGEVWPEDRMGEVGKERLAMMKAEGVLPMILDMRKTLGGGSGDKVGGKKVGVRGVSEVGVGGGKGMLDGLGADIDMMKGVIGILNALPGDDVGEADVQVEAAKGNGGTEGKQENLEDLVGDLLKALKTDSGRAEFARMAKTEDALKNIF